MIVDHKAGEKVAGFMSRQYRTAFNAGAAATAAAGSTLGWLLIADPMLWAWPTGVAVVAYGVNLRGRRHRIPTYELKKPTKDTEDEILELQDIHFHMPAEHQHLTDKLLNGAYEQISLGNVDAVQPRLQQARALRSSIVAHNAQLDTKEDIKEVQLAQKRMALQLEAGPSAASAGEGRQINDVEQVVKSGRVYDIVDGPSIRKTSSSRF